MTSCLVHAIVLPGCPHSHPADTYRASREDQPPTREAIDQADATPVPTTPPGSVA